MINLFSIDTTLFTFMGYPMSYLEFFGTILNIWSVYLTAKRKVLSWPVGIIAVILFFILFYQIRLYSDMVEQAYFFFTGFYGWWAWKQVKAGESLKSLKVLQTSMRENLVYIISIAIGTLLLGTLMSKIHLILPTLFTVAADYPYLDAFTTVMSFAATILMAQKKLECWYLWILVDIIGIGLYYVKDVKFIALEYVVFLVLATSGLIAWKRALDHHAKAPETAYPTI
jgi:nicotinamide mononucleotide transporter